MYSTHANALSKYTLSANFLRYSKLDIVLEINEVSNQRCRHQKDHEETKRNKSASDITSSSPLYPTRNTSKMVMITNTNTTWIYSLAADNDNLPHIGAPIGTVIL